MHKKKTCTLSMVLVPVSMEDVYSPAGLVLKNEKKKNSGVLICVFVFNAAPTYLISCTPTKSILYFDNSFDAVTRELTLYKLLTYQVPSCMSIYCHLGRLSKESIQVPESFIIFFLFLLIPMWSTTPCRLSTAAYGMYSQLPSNNYNTEN
jgi:hypothetical protein